MKERKSLSYKHTHENKLTEVQRVRTVLRQEEKALP